MLLLRQLDNNKTPQPEGWLLLLFLFRLLGECITYPGLIARWWLVVMEASNKGSAVV